MSTVVEVRDGSLALAGRPVVRGVDLSVRRGEVVAVLGANGSGKSTLVRGLVGLLPWTSGDVRLFDTPLGRFSDWRRIGYVPQQLSPNSGVPATVQEVVSAGRLAHRRLLLPLRAADRRAVRSALEAVDLVDRRAHAVGQLSGGQQQRVMIARALATEPDLLVLDEPNSGVDQTGQRAFASVLRPMVAAGATVIVVLHETGPFEDLIDRAVVLRDGRVTYDGPPPDAALLEEFSSHHHERRTPNASPLGGGLL